MVKSERSSKRQARRKVDTKLGWSIPSSRLFSKLSLQTQRTKWQADFEDLEHYLLKTLFELINFCNLGDVLFFLNLDFFLMRVLSSKVLIGTFETILIHMTFFSYIFVFIILCYVVITLTKSTLRLIQPGYYFRSVYLSCYLNELTKLMPNIVLTVTTSLIIAMVHPIEDNLTRS